MPRAIIFSSKYPLLPPSRVSKLHFGQAKQLLAIRERVVSYYGGNSLLVVSETVVSERIVRQTEYPILNLYESSLLVK